MQESKSDCVRKNICLDTSVGETTLLDEPFVDVSTTSIIEHETVEDSNGDVEHSEYFSASEIG